MQDRHRSPMNNVAPLGMLDRFSAGRNVASEVEAIGLFTLLRGNQQLVWEISSNGCWERAHEICRILAADGVACAKVFAMSGLRLGIGDRDMKPPRSPKAGPWVPWPMHVAPCVRLEIGGAISAVVLDPTVLDGPGPISSWLKTLGDDQALAEIQRPEHFQFSNYHVTPGLTLELGGFSSDYDFVKTGKGLAELARGRAYLCGD